VPGAPIVLSVSVSAPERQRLLMCSYLRSVGPT
jgi:hypothetical protein